MKSLHYRNGPNPESSDQPLGMDNYLNKMLEFSVALGEAGAPVGGVSALCRLRVGGGWGLRVLGLLRARLVREAGAGLVREGWEGAELDRVSRLVGALLLSEPAWMARRVDTIEPWARPMSEREASPWR